MNIEKIQILKECNDKIFSYEISKKFDNIIFVYTPPKVGSTTLVSSIRLSASNNFLTAHIHDEKMLNILTNYDETNTITINDIIEYNASLGKNVFVIDVYRNPIERKISEYFELLANYHFNNCEANMNKYNIELIIKRFNRIFTHVAEGDYFFEKYDITPPESFNFDNKYLSVVKNNIKYIKLRLIDSHLWGKILSEILNTEIIIVKDYQTENKAIGNIYNEFKSRYKIPINFFERIKSCKYFNYYNSEEERKSYLNEWSNKITGEFEAFTIDQFKLYKEISTENQFNNVIQRNHYLDFGCICKSCFFKRKQIINKIKSGMTDINIRVIHEEAVAEKKIRKVKVLSNICNNIQKIQYKKPSGKNMGTDFTLSGIIVNKR